MAGSPTTNYGWIKPDVGGDADQWGVDINSNLDGIDSALWAVQGTANAAMTQALGDARYLRLTGGTITGNLTAPSFVATGGIAGDASGNPPVLMLDPPIGDNTKKVPSTGWVTANALMKGGGTLTGALILAADPAVALGASTKQYTDTKASLAGAAFTGAVSLPAGSTVAGYLPLTGGTLTGNLVVAGANGIVQANGYLQGSGGVGANIRADGGVNVKFVYASATSTLNVQINNATQSYPWLLASGSATHIEAIGGAGGPSGSAGYFYGSSNQAVAWWYCDGVSDARIKTNIQPTKIDALDAIIKLDVDEFDYVPRVAEAYSKSDPHVPIGMIAQKVQALMPDAVGAMPDEAHGTDSPFPPGCLSLVDSAFTPYLIRAIQQLTARVAELEAKLGGS